MPQPARAARLAFHAAALLAAGLAATAARADDDGLSTDRPDFVNSPDVVGAGRVQVEAGPSWENDRADGGTAHLRSTPALLRVGIGPDWELRLETDGAMRRTGPQPSDGASGTAGLGIGAKWHWRDGDATRGTPGLGWLFDLGTPSGSRDFHGDGFDPSVAFALEWDLPGDLSVGVMPGVGLVRDANGQAGAAGVLAVSVDRGLAGGVHGFVELAGQQLATARYGGNVVTADTGLTWQIGKSLQLDASVFKGLTDAAPKLQWGVGASFRF